MSKSAPTISDASIFLARDVEGESRIAVYYFSFDLNRIYDEVRYDLIFQYLIINNNSILRLY